MNSPTQPVTFLLDPEDNQRLADLCGEHNAHLKQVEEGFGVRISHRGHLFCVDGQDQDVRNAQDVLCALYADSGNGASLSPDQIQVAISQIPRKGLNDQDGPDDVVIRVRKAMIRGKSSNQKRYLGNILRHDINFGIGPAGTGFGKDFPRDKNTILAHNRKYGNVPSGVALVSRITGAGHEVDRRGKTPSSRI